MKFTKTMIVAVALVALCGFVLADTQDKTLGSAYGYPTKGGVVLFERTLDFSTSTHTGTASDVYQLFNVPAGSYVLGVGYEVEDGESSGTYLGEDGTCTIDIGDGSDTDGWIDGANVQTGQTATAYVYWPSAGNITLTNVPTAAVTNTYQVISLETGVNGAYTIVGKLYQASDTIDLKLNNAADKLKITTRAAVIPAAGY